jgi:hypothetical protein
MAGGLDGRNVTGWVPEPEFLLWWAADRFGWTPAQVGAIPARQLAWLRHIDTRMRRRRGGQ